MLINGVITTMLLLLFTARPALSEYSTIGAGTILCKPFCKGPCSGFSRPDIECNGCGEDMTCNPNADDYHKGMYDSTEDRAAAEATDCAAHCQAPCSGFSSPRAECSGCGEDMQCRPGAPDYETGRVQPATAAAEQHETDAILAHEAFTRAFEKRSQASAAWETARAAAVELDIDAMSEEDARALLHRLQDLERKLQDAQAEELRARRRHELVTQRAAGAAGTALSADDSARRNAREVEAAGAELDGALARGLLLAPHDLCPLQRVNATALRALSPIARALLLLREPTIIEGLIDHWPAVTELGDAESLRKNIGHVALNADRDHVRNGEAKTLGDVGMSWTHIIAFSNWDTTEARQLDSIMDKFFDVPDVLAHRTSCSIFSLGGLPMGARMAHHGFSWLGMAAGSKRWYVAPPTVPQPPEPSCRPRGHPVEIENVTACLQRQGEVLALTESWWHATCNVHPHTIGIGGQDNANLPDPPFLPRLDPVLGKWGRDMANNRGTKAVSWKVSPRPFCTGTECALYEGPESSARAIEMPKAPGAVDEDLGECSVID